MKQLKGVMSSAKPCSCHAFGFPFTSLTLVVIDQTQVILAFAVLFPWSCIVFLQAIT